MLNKNKRLLIGLGKALVEAEGALVKVIARMTKELKQLNRAGCKKPNSQPLASKTVQVLAVGTNEELPVQNYCMGTEENKQGAKGC
ncbi:hypothetical protein [Xenorhabdus taiwanensis]|uniref:Uncharacterized protein n=1 Tax=Xenorhabdus taiwanensis TaxID=3085177 RepID=A0ABN7C6W2_9GAMM|nr:hypothetical protein TCT1_30440 [Xenorhabdus sp. TCT-1]